MFLPNGKHRSTLWACLGLTWKIGRRSSRCKSRLDGIFSANVCVCVCECRLEKFICFLLLYYCAENVLCRMIGWPLRFVGCKTKREVLSRGF